MEEESGQRRVEIRGGVRTRESGDKGWGWDGVVGLRWGWWLETGYDNKEIEMCARNGVGNMELLLFFSYRS